MKIIKFWWVAIITIVFFTIAIIFYLRIPAKPLLEENSSQSIEMQSPDVAVRTLDEKEIQVTEESEPKKVEQIVEARELTQEQAAIDFQMMNPDLFIEQKDPSFAEALVTNRMEIDWEASRVHPKLADKDLTLVQRETIAGASVPVLLPESQGLRESGVLSIGDQWYAASMKDEEVNVSISGTAKLVTPAGMSVEDFNQSLPSINDYRSSVTKSLGIVEADFEAFGVIYNVSVECYNHDTNPACAEYQYIYELIDSLLIAGGTQEEKV